MSKEVVSFLRSAKCLKSELSTFFGFDYSPSFCDKSWCCSNCQVQGFIQKISIKADWKTLEYFWKTLEKQGRPPLKNKNSSDLSHFEIKFGKKWENFIFKKKLKVCIKSTFFQKNRKFYFQLKKVPSVKKWITYFDNALLSLNIDL